MLLGRVAVSYSTLSCTQNNGCQFFLAEGSIINILLAGMIVEKKMIVNYYNFKKKRLVFIFYCHIIRTTLKR